MTKSISGPVFFTQLQINTQYISIFGDLHEHDKINDCNERKESEDYTIGEFIDTISDDNNVYIYLEGYLFPTNDEKDFLGETLITMWNKRTQPNVHYIDYREISHPTNRNMSYELCTFASDTLYANTNNRLIMSKLSSYKDLLNRGFNLLNSRITRNTKWVGVVDLKDNFIKYIDIFLANNTISETNFIKMNNFYIALQSAIVNHYAVELVLTNNNPSVIYVGFIHAKEISQILVNFFSYTKVENNDIIQPDDNRCLKLPIIYLTNMTSVIVFGVYKKKPKKRKKIKKGGQKIIKLDKLYKLATKAGINIDIKINKINKTNKIRNKVQDINLDKLNKLALKAGIKV